MKTKLKSILAIALCAVGLAAFAEEPAGSEGNPWLVGTPNEADVKAWTNGTGKLTIEGTGAMMDFGDARPPWSSVKGTIITVEIGSGVMNIAKESFSSCKKLTSVTIPAGVTNIGNKAFSNCSALKSVTILSSVMSIGHNAFYKCSMVAELKVQSIEDWCKVVVDENGSHPFSYSEVATSKLIAGGKEITELVIPSTITEIRMFTFQNCYGVTSVTIPSSVTSIGERAFAGCSGLTSVTIPSSVTNIGFCAFNNCSGLTSAIVMRETPPVGDTVFGDISMFNGTIYVPEGSVDAYKTAEGWDTYATKIFSAYLVSGVAEHGSLSFDKICFPVESYKEPSETVTVTVTPDEGYLFKSLVWNDGTDHDITEAKSFTMPLKSVTVTAVFEAEQPEPPPEPEGVSAESEAFAFDVREEIALAKGAVTVAGVSYSDTAWGAAGAEDVTLGCTNVGTHVTGELKSGLSGEGATEVDLPKKDGGYRLTHSTGKLTSFVKFTVSGYPLGSEGNPWEIGANAAADVIAFSNGTDTVFFDPVRGTVTKAGLETITNAMGGASFPAKLIAADGSETNELVMVLGASGTAYESIADALAANEASYTLFETKGYFVSYEGGWGSNGKMNPDAFIPTVPTNLTANAYTIVGYDFDGWSKDGTTVAYTNRQEGVDFAKPGETLVLTALWTHVGVEPTDYNDLVAKLPQVTRPVTFDLVRDIEIPAGGAINVPSGKSVTFNGIGKFDVTAEHPALFCGYPVGTGLKPEDLDRFVTDKDVKAYYEDGKVVVRGRGETEEFPWLLGTAGHEDEVTAWADNEMIFTKPTRGTASVAALQSVTNALKGYVPGPGELKVISADGTATNDVVMLLGSDGVPYDTLADVFAADPMPETVRLFEVKGASVEFNAMGGVHADDADGREIVTNFCVVTYELPTVERDGYTFAGWHVGWKTGAAEVTNGQDLVTFEPHALYAQWTAKNPTPKAGELDVPDVKNGQPVTTIEAGAYNGNASLSTVVTPLYLNSIGMYAFQGCSSLKTLTITAARSYDDLSPVKVTVAQNAFSGCSSLETVYVAAEIDKLGKSAFQSCAKLKRIVFQGDGRIDYGSSAFYRCGYQNGTGSLKVYMSRAFQENNAALIADFKKWNTQVEIIEKVDVMPVNGIGEIAGIDLGSMSADRRVAVLVKTSVLGTPDPDDVDIEHTTELNGTWSPLKDGTEKTANPDGTVLIEIKVPEGAQGFFRAKVTE